MSHASHIWRLSTYSTKLSCIGIDGSAECHPDVGQGQRGVENDVSSTHGRIRHAVFPHFKPKGMRMRRRSGWPVFCIDSHRPIHLGNVTLQRVRVGRRQNHLLGQSSDARSDLSMNESSEVTIRTIRHLRRRDQTRRFGDSFEKTSGDKYGTESREEKC